MFSPSAFSEGSHDAEETMEQKKTVLRDLCCNHDATHDDFSRWYLVAGHLAGRLEEMREERVQNLNTAPWTYYAGDITFGEERWTARILAKHSLVQNLDGERLPTDVFFIYRGIRALVEMQRAKGSDLHIPGMRDLDMSLDETAQPTSRDLREMRRVAVAVAGFLKPPRSTLGTAGVLFGIGVSEAARGDFVNSKEAAQALEEDLTRYATQFGRTAIWSEGVPTKQAPDVIDCLQSSWNCLLQFVREQQRCINYFAGSPPQDTGDLDNVSSAGAKCMQATLETLDDDNGERFKTWVQAFGEWHALVTTAKGNAENTLNAFVKFYTEDELILFQGTVKNEAGDLDFDPMSGSGDVRGKRFLRLTMQHHLTNLYHRLLQCYTALQPTRILTWLSAEDAVKIQHEAVVCSVHTYSGFTAVDIGIRIDGSLTVHCDDDGKKCIEWSTEHSDAAQSVEGILEQNKFLCAQVADPADQSEKHAVLIESIAGTVRCFWGTQELQVVTRCELSNDEGVFFKRLCLLTDIDLREYKSKKALMVMKETAADLIEARKYEYGYTTSLTYSLRHLTSRMFRMNFLPRGNEELEKQWCERLHPSVLAERLVMPEDGRYIHFVDEGTHSHLVQALRGIDFHFMEVSVDSQSLSSKIEVLKAKKAMQGQPLIRINVLGFIDDTRAFERAVLCEESSSATIVIISNQFTQRLIDLPDLRDLVVVHCDMPNGPMKKKRTFHKGYPLGLLTMQNTGNEPHDEVRASYEKVVQMYQSFMDWEGYVARKLAEVREGRLLVLVICTKQGNLEDEVVKQLTRKHAFQRHDPSGDVSTLPKNGRVQVKNTHKLEKKQAMLRSAAAMGVACVALIGKDMLCEDLGQVFLDSTHEMVVVPVRVEAPVTEACSDGAICCGMPRVPFEFFVQWFPLAQLLERVSAAALYCKATGAVMSDEAEEEDAAVPEQTPGFEFSVFTKDLSGDTYLQNELQKHRDIDWEDSRFQDMRLPTQFLIRLLEVYPQNLKLLAAQVPDYLYVCLLGLQFKKVPGWLCRLREQVSDPLVEARVRKTQGAKPGCVNARFFSLIRAALLTKGVECPFDDVDFNNVVSSKCDIDMASIKDRTNAQLLVKQLVQLDREERASAYREQAHIKDYFLTTLPEDEIGGWLLDKMRRGGLRIGSAFLQMLHETRSKGGGVLDSYYNGVTELFQYFEGATLEPALLPHLSLSAWCLLLTRADLSPDSLRTLLQKFIESHNRVEDRVALVQLMYSKDHEAGCTALCHFSEDGILVAWPEHDATLRVERKALQTGECDEMLGRPVALHLERHALLLKHYMDTVARGVKASGHGIAWLVGIFAQLQYTTRVWLLTAEIDQKAQQLSTNIRVALWFTVPAMPFPCAYEEELEMLQSLKELKKTEKWAMFNTLVLDSQDSVSPAARALAGLHHLLDDVSYEKYREVMGWRQLETKEFMITPNREGDTAVYVPYVLRVARRVLPQDVFEGLSKNIDLSQCRPLSLAERSFDISSGVDKRKVQMNLNALRWTSSFQKSEWGDYAQMALCICTWFFSFGFKSVDDIISLAGQDLNEEFASLRKVFTEVTKAPTFSFHIGFPMICASHYRLRSSACRLFGSDGESVLYTYNMLHKPFAHLPAVPGESAMRSVRGMVHGDLKRLLDTCGKITARRVHGKAQARQMKIVFPVSRLLVPLSSVLSFLVDDQKVEEAKALVRSFLEELFSIASPCKETGLVSAALLMSIGYSLKVTMSLVNEGVAVVLRHKDGCVVSTCLNELVYLLGLKAVELEFTITDVKKVKTVEIPTEGLPDVPDLMGTTVQSFARPAQSACSAALAKVQEGQAPHEELPWEQVAYFEQKVSEEIEAECSEAKLADLVYNKIPEERMALDVREILELRCASDEPFFFNLVLGKGLACYLVRTLGRLKITLRPPENRVERSFTTPWEAWVFCSSLPSGSALLADGFFLVRVRNHWVLHFTAEREDVRFNMCHSLALYKLFHTQQDAINENVVKLAKWMVDGLATHMDQGAGPVDSTVGRVCKIDDDEDLDQVSEFNDLVTKRLLLAVLETNGSGSIGKLWGEVYKTLSEEDTETVRRCLGNAAAKDAQIATNKLRTEAKLEEFKYFMRIGGEGPLDVALKTNPKLIDHLRDAVDRVSRWLDDDGYFDLATGEFVPSGNTPEGREYEMGSQSLIGGELGYGLIPITAKTVDLTYTCFHNPHNEKSLRYFKLLDNLPAFEPSQGLSIGRVYDVRLCTGTDTTVRTWLEYLLGSPLNVSLKQWLARHLLCDYAEKLPEKPDAFALVVLYCLACRLPMAGTKSTLLSKLEVGRADLPDFEALCTRVDNRFGMHTLKYSPRHEWLACVSTDYYMNSGLSDEEQYTQVVRKFRRNVTHVWVHKPADVKKGADASEPFQLSDSLLKWWAEYTEQHPWHFVMLIDCYTYGNTSENRDRVCSKMPVPEEDELVMTTEADFSPPVEMTPEQEAEMYKHRATRGEGEWKTRVINAVRASGRRTVILLTGPPGVGKTYSLNEEAGRADTAYYRLDCSDACLVRETLVELLERTLPFGKDGLPGGEMAVLVCDEYHMIKTVDKKMELVNWVMERTSWLKVVFVANRKDELDKKIMQRFRDNFDKEPELGGTVEEANACMTSAGIDECIGSNDKLNRELMHQLLQTFRLLFGDESVSLRMWRLFEGSKDEIKENCFSTFKEKLLRFGLYSPGFAVWYFFEFHDLEGTLHEKYNKFVTSRKNGLATLVATASLVSNLGDQILPYIDFVSKNSEHLQWLHPAVKLHYYMQYLWSVAGPEGVGHRNKLDGAVRNQLLQLDYIDQTAFPIIKTTPPVGSNIEVGQAASTHGDYEDLGWMCNCLAHGEQFNWAEVGKIWRAHWVTDVNGLGTILQRAKHSWSRILEALDQGNLMLLVSDPAARTVRDAVLSAYPRRQLEDELYAASSPWMLSVWNAVKGESLEKWRGNISGVLEGEEIKAMLQQVTHLGAAEPFREDMPHVAVLLWASAFGTKTVASDEEQRTEQLQRMLFDQTEKLLEKYPRKCEEVLGKVWNDLFHPLLRFRTPCTAEGVRLDAAVKVVLVMKHCLPNWPKYVELLHKAVHRKYLTFEEVQRLLSILRLDDPSWVGSAVSFPPRLLAAMLQAKEAGCLSRLPMKQQHALLRVPSKLDKCLLLPDGRMTLLKNMDTALMLAQKEDIGITGDIGEVLREQWERHNGAA